MCEHYVLIPIADNFWKATDRIYYEVTGWTDKNKMATFSRGYKTKASAMNFIRKAIKENRFESITLRKNVTYLKNSDSLDISSSCPVRHWEI